MHGTPIRSQAATGTLNRTFILPLLPFQSPPDELPEHYSARPCTPDPRLLFARRDLLESLPGRIGRAVERGDDKEANELALRLREFNWRIDTETWEIIDQRLSWVVEGRGRVVLPRQPRKREPHSEAVMRLYRRLKGSGRWDCGQWRRMEGEGGRPWAEVGGEGVEDGKDGLFAQRAESVLVDGQPGPEVVKREDGEDDDDEDGGAERSRWGQDGDLRDYGQFPEHIERLVESDAMNAVQTSRLSDRRPESNGGRPSRRSRLSRGAGSFRRILCG